MNIVKVKNEDTIINIMRTSPDIFVMLFVINDITTDVKKIKKYIKHLQNIPLNLKLIYIEYKNFTFTKNLYLRNMLNSINNKVDKIFPYFVIFYNEYFWFDYYNVSYDSFLSSYNNIVISYQNFIYTYNQMIINNNKKIKENEMRYVQLEKMQNLFNEYQILELQKIKFVKELNYN